MLMCIIQLKAEVIKMADFVIGSKEKEKNMNSLHVELKQIC